MKTSYGFDQCYNGQLVVDATTQIIVGTDLTASAADNRYLVPLLDQVTTTMGKCPHTAVADNGFVGEDHFVAVEARGITPYVSLGREGRAPHATAPGPATARMAARLASDEGRAVYRRRKVIVEPVIGWIKHVLGFRQFSVRGEAKTRGEWTLVCLAVNLKRLHAFRSKAVRWASAAQTPRASSAPSTANYFWVAVYKAISGTRTSLNAQCLSVTTDSV